MELPLQMYKIELCVNFACMMIKYHEKTQLYCKLLFGCVNTILSFLFFLRINKKSAKNIKNRAVKITLIVEICFNILPTFFNFILSIIVSEPLNNYLGQYVEMFCMMDAACCSVLYTLIFVKKHGRIYNNKNTNFTVSTTPRTT
uniref:Uncharacterized protein n=1 Tax=Ditylenchus dipsaci TaxID=166011 RepID=A0A915CVW9_9BILA